MSAAISAMSAAIISTVEATISTVEAAISAVNAVVGCFILIQLQLWRQASPAGRSLGLELALFGSGR